MSKNNKKVANNATLAGNCRMYKRGVHITAPDVPETLKQYAEPLGRQLVGQQVDGVSLNSASLLSRQYDDEFGKVDPASDIHTDQFLLQDALMRDYRTGLINAQTEQKTE